MKVGGHIESQTNGSVSFMLRHKTKGERFFFFFQEPKS